MLPIGHAFAIVLVLGASLAPCTAASLCYCLNNNTITICGSGSSNCGQQTAKSPGGAQLCCVPGDTCGQDSVCHFTKDIPGTSGYYFGGCTDPTMQDPICARHCGDAFVDDIVFSDSTSLWSCCGYPNQTTSCAHPRLDDTFQLFAPTKFSALATAVVGGATSTSSYSSSTSKTSSITSSSSTSTPSTTGSTVSGSGDNLTTAAEAGIGIGVAILVVGVGIGIGLIFLLRRRGRQGKTEVQSVGSSHKFYSLQEVRGNGYGYEARGGGVEGVHELQDVGFHESHQRQEGTGTMWRTESELGRRELGDSA